jgi:hypothetical protein
MKHKRRKPFRIIILCEWDSKHLGKLQKFQNWLTKMASTMTVKLSIEIHWECKYLLNYFWLGCRLVQSNSKYLLIRTISTLIRYFAIKETQFVWVVHMNISKTGLKEFSVFNYFVLTELTFIFGLTISKFFPHVEILSWCDCNLVSCLIIFFIVTLKLKHHFTRICSSYLDRSTPLIFQLKEY